MYISPVIILVSDELKQAKTCSYCNHKTWIGVDGYGDFCYASGDYKDVSYYTKACSLYSEWKGDK